MASQTPFAKLFLWSRSPNNQEHKGDITSKKSMSSVKFACSLKSNYQVTRMNVDVRPVILKMTFRRTSWRGLCRHKERQIPVPVRAGIHYIHGLVW